MISNNKDITKINVHKKKKTKKTHSFTALHTNGEKLRQETRPQITIFGKTFAHIHTLTH